MTGSSIFTSASACERGVRCHSPNGLPLTAMTRSPSTMPQDVFPEAVNWSQRMLDSLLFGRDLRLSFPAACGRARQSEIFAQGFAGIIVVKQAAPLQFRDHVTDEIGVRAGHVSSRNDKAVAAAAREHLLQPVGDLPGSADDRVGRLAAAAEDD